jgi:hypothetical protein
MHAIFYISSQSLQIWNSHLVINSSKRLTYGRHGRGERIFGGAMAGMANTALAPMAAFGPLLAGWLAEQAGYNALFLALLAIGLAGVLGLHWGVPAPVRASAAAASE